MNRSESDAILANHGRQALARVIYTELPAEQRDADLFYAMYGDTFPESERIKLGDAFEPFDPCNFEAFYRQGDPWFKRARDLDDGGTIDVLIDAHLNRRAPLFGIETLWDVLNNPETRKRIEAAPDGTHDFETWSWLCNLSDRAQMALWLFINRRYPNPAAQDDPEYPPSDQNEFEREASATYANLLRE